MGLQLRYYLKPFNKLHTSHPEVKTQVILLSIVAALLILISLLNYILIVISSLVKRSKEELYPDRHLFPGEALQGSGCAEMLWRRRKAHLWIVVEGGAAPHRAVAGPGSPDYFRRP